MRERGREEGMSERKKDKVEKEETFIAPVEVDSCRGKRWVEGGDKWGLGSEEGDREEAKQEKVTERKKPRGRPTKAESLGKSRRDSANSIVSLLSKRGRTNDSGRGEEDDKGITQSVKRAKEGEPSQDGMGDGINMEKIEKMMNKQREDTVKEMTLLLARQREEIVKQIKTELMEEVRREVKNEMKKEIEKFREEERIARKILESELEKMRKIIQDSEKRTQEQERRERSLNIVVRGEKVEGRRVMDAVTKVFEKIGVKDRGIKVKDVFKLRSREDDSLILVKLYSMDEKRMIMEKKNKLKGTTIYVDDDLTKNERERQSAMRVWAKSEREKGMSVKVGIGRAWMNGREYVWNEERKCMNEKIF